MASMVVVLNRTLRKHLLGIISSMLGTGDTTIKTACFPSSSSSQRKKKQMTTYDVNKVTTKTKSEGWGVVEEQRGVCETVFQCKLRKS